MGDTPHCHRYYIKVCSRIGSSISAPLRKPVLANDLSMHPYLTELKRFWYPKTPRPPHLVKMIASRWWSFPMSGKLSKYRFGNQRSYVISNSSGDFLMHLTLLYIFMYSKKEIGDKQTVAPQLLHYHSMSHFSRIEIYLVVLKES